MGWACQLLLSVGLLLFPDCCGGADSASTTFSCPVASPGCCPAVAATCCCRAASAAATCCCRAASARTAADARRAAIEIDRKWGPLSAALSGTTLGGAGRRLAAAMVCKGSSMVCPAELTASECADGLGGSNCSVDEGWVGSNMARVNACLEATESTSFRMRATSSIPASRSPERERGARATVRGRITRGITFFLRHNSFS